MFSVRKQKKNLFIEKKNAESDTNHQWGVNFFYLRDKFFGKNNLQKDTLLSTSLPQFIMSKKREKTRSKPQVLQLDNYDETNNFWSDLILFVP